ncbi:MAG: methyltransferase domain-containing protein [Acidobacteriota bacterium]|nr:MAG: methyltransferase domain-containing protein [Acidobacteriota bacterium]
MAGSAVNFLKEFVTNPQKIGAIAPSSEELAGALAGSIDWDRVRVAAEYGPGLGSITRAILERLDGQDFFAIELNQAYADALSKQFSDLSVYCDSVANIEQIAAAHGAIPIDAVVSSLPWANFSEGLQDELLDATMNVLAADGQFATFSYVHGLMLKSAQRFHEKLERRFRSVERGDVVWRSVPPAVVYHCQR